MTLTGGGSFRKSRQLATLLKCLNKKRTSPGLLHCSWLPSFSGLPSALFSWGMVLITWPAIRILCLPNLFLDQPRTRSPQTGVEASRTTLAGLGSNTFAAGDMDSGHCPPGYGFSLGGGGRELPAARMEMREQQALKEAGFTVVSLPAPGRGEPRGRQCPPRRRGRR